MKCLTDGLQKIMLGSNMPNRDPLFAIVDQRKHAVIGSDKSMPVRSQKHRPPRRSDPRIDNYHVYGFRRVVRIGLRNSQRAIQNVERLHGMADVNDLGLRSNSKNHALHTANKMIV